MFALRVGKDVYIALASTTSQHYYVIYRRIGKWRSLASGGHRGALTPLASLESELCTRMDIL